MATIASILRDGEDPSMPALRQWLQNLEATVAATLVGLRVFKSVADLNAYVPSGDQPIYAFVADGTAFTGYRYTSAWAVDTSFYEGITAIAQPIFDEAVAAADRAEASEVGAAAVEGRVLAAYETVDAVIQAARRNYQTIAGYPGEDTVWRIGGENWPTATFTGWALFQDGADIKGEWSAIEAFMNPGSATTRLRFTIVSRIIANADPDRPPFFGADVVVQQFYRTPQQLGLVPGGDINRALALFDAPIIPDPTKSYGIVIEALNNADAPTALGIARAVIQGTPSPRKRGFFRLPPDPTISGSFAFTDDGTQSFALAVEFKTDAFQDFSDIAANRFDIDSLEASFTKSTVVSGSRLSDGYWEVSEAWKSWSVVVTATDIDDGRLISRIAPTIAVEGGAVSLRMQIWKRPIGAPDIYGHSAGEYLVEDTFHLLGNLGITAGQDFARVSIPIRNTVVKDAGHHILWKISALKTGSIPASIAIRRAESIASGLSQGQRGWGYRGNVPLPIAAPRAVSWEIESDVYLPAFAEQCSSVAGSSSDQVISANASVIGRSVKISNGVIGRFGERVPFEGTIAITAPPIVSVTNVPYTINYFNGQRYWSYLLTRTPHGNLLGLVVKDAATSAVLTEGVDYIVDRKLGGFARAAAGPARNVLISYTSSQERYDLICVDPEFLSLYAVQGGTGVRDASERMPDTGTKNGQSQIPMRLPLFYARVTFATIELIKVWNLRDGVAREYEAQVLADQRRNRAAILPFLNMVETGQPTTWSAFGDSTTAFQSENPDRLIPNGPYRDKATANGTTYRYLREGIIGGDLIDAIPSNFSNGNLADATHTRFGRVWEVIKAAESTFDADVEYLNYSIAGTNSDDSSLGMNDPDRRAAWASDGADLGIILDGMNSREVGVTLLFNRIRTLIDAKYAAGAKGVIVWGCARPNDIGADVANFVKVNRVLRQAAETPGWGGRTAAFIDTSLISYGEGAGSMGFVAQDYCLANGASHPGIRQNKIEGEFARKVIFG